jgi:hypothetical protein
VAARFFPADSPEDDATAFPIQPGTGEFGQTIAILGLGILLPSSRVRPPLREIELSVIKENSYVLGLPSRILLKTADDLAPKDYVPHESAIGCCLDVILVSLIDRRPHEFRQPKPLVAITAKISLSDLLDASMRLRLQQHDPSQRVVSNDDPRYVANHRRWLLCSLRRLKLHIDQAQELGTPIREW